MVKSEGPDKGQAWVVAIAACLITMIASGLARMRALLYVAVIETYGVSRQVAAEPFVVRASLRCLGELLAEPPGELHYNPTKLEGLGGLELAAFGTFAGGEKPVLRKEKGIAALCPIIGVIGQRYGVKVATFWGGVVCSLGIAFCCIAPNVFWLTVFWGGLYGFGHGLAETLYPVLINQYFVKYRATALGIAVSGASIGSIVLPVITVTVLDKFGLSGGFLIFGGIAMHILPLSMLLKSPRWLQNPKQYIRSKALKVKQQTGDTLERGLQEVPPEECRKTGSTISEEESHAIPIPTIYGELVKKQSDINSSAPCEKTFEIRSGKKTSLLESVRGIGTLYMNPVFALISVCMAMYTIISISIAIVAVDYGKDKGIAESYEVHIINSAAAGDLIGKLCFSWVTDKKILSIPTYLAMTFILQAVFLFLLPLVRNLYSFMLLLALYGTTDGTVRTHFPLLMLRYVDKNFQSLAIGCEGFLSGIVSFAISSIVGYFRDDVGSYDGMIYLMGSMSVVSACFWSLLPLLEEFQRKKGEQNKMLREKMEIQQHFEENKSTGVISNVNGENSESLKSNLD